jgi:hypothetical protein
MKHLFFKFLNSLKCIYQNKIILQSTCSVLLVVLPIVLQQFLTLQLEEKKHASQVILELMKTTPDKEELSKSLTFFKKTNILHDINSEYIEPANLPYLPAIGEYMSYANGEAVREELLKNEKEDIFLSAVNYHLSAKNPRYRENLLGRLKKGYRVRFLVYNPNKENFSALASFQGQEEDVLYYECLLSMVALRDFENVWNKLKKNYTGILEIRVINKLSKARIELFGNHAAFKVDFKEGQNSTFLKAEKPIRDKPTLELLSKEIEIDWNKSDDFQIWKESHPQMPLQF